MTGAGADVAVAVGTQVRFGGLIRLQKPHLNLAERFGIVHQPNPKTTHSINNTLAKQAAPTNK